VKIESFFAELKRRSVYKVAVAYAVVAWLLIQVATQVFPFFELPNWAVQVVVLAVVIGFPIAVVCSWAFEMTPEGIKREAEVDRRITRKTGRKLTALLVVGAAAATGLMLFRLLHSQEAIEQGKQAPPAPEIDRKSIAVLPFENLSDDRSNAYFTDGIQDEILTRLAKIADLKVISRTSTQHYKSTPENLREIAQQLGVAHILEGSVQKSGDAVRVNVQLIKAATDSHLWADSFDQGRRFEGDFAHLDTTFQKRARKFAADREAARRGAHFGRQRAKSRPAGARECAADQCHDRCAPLGRHL
jgi:TolB-like protein